MYFSNFNKAITYQNHYGAHGEALLDVCCEEKSASLCKEDTDVFPTDPEWDKFGMINITSGITEIKAGFLETFINMKTLFLYRSVTNIEITDELNRLFRKNKVKIKGWYDTYGEAMALQKHLSFSHDDIFIGWSRDEIHHASTKLIIRFTDNNKPYLFFDEYSPGSSAGSMLGGSWEKNLPEDFYIDMTLEKFASTLPNFREPILKNEDLAYYFETANKRKKN